MQVLLANVIAVSFYSFSFIDLPHFVMLNKLSNSYSPSPQRDFTLPDSSFPNKPDSMGSYWQILVIPVLISLLFSCGESSNVSETEIEAYQVDTVKIDSKDRNLDIRMNLMFSGVDPNRKFLLNFNQFDMSIDEIDLEAETFAKSYSLEAEGPNGVGPMVVGVQVLNDSLFFTKSFVISSILNKQGQVKERIAWEEAKDAEGNSLPQFPRRYEWISESDPDKIAALSYDIQNKKVYLDILTRSTGTVKRIDADPENTYKKYLLLSDDQVNFRDPAIKLSGNGDHFLVSHEYSNEILVVDLNGDVQQLAQPESQLIPAKAEVPGEPLYKTSEQSRDAYMNLVGQVRYEPLAWDGQTERYYRLAAQKVFEEIKEEGSEEIQTITKTKVFVTVLDADFKLLSVIPVKELSKEEVKYFAKDGKLWVAQNLDDELSFIVISIPES